MSRPYMELSVGLDNILRFIRLDYVWRLNYLDVPYEIDRRGLRVALHFTFEIFFEKIWMLSNGMMSFCRIGRYGLRPVLP